MNMIVIFYRLSAINTLFYQKLAWHSFFFFLFSNFLKLRIFCIELYDRIFIILLWKRCCVFVLKKKELAMNSVKNEIYILKEKDSIYIYLYIHKYESILECTAKESKKKTDLMNL